MTTTRRDTRTKAELQMDLYEAVRIMGEYRAALERCESVIATNMRSMDAEGFSPNPWDVQAHQMATEALYGEPVSWKRAA